MYRHRLRPPGGNRLALNGRAGLSGSIGSLFTKALGALSLAMRGRTALSQSSLTYITTAPIIPVWSVTPPYFVVSAGETVTYPLNVTATGYAITLAWVGPGTIGPGGTYPWITLNSGVNPSITFTNPPVASVVNVLIDATVNITTTRSPAGGSITVEAISWNASNPIPNKTFIYQGGVQTYDLKQHVSNWNAAFYRIDLYSGSLPNGVSLASDGSGVLTYNNAGTLDASGTVSYAIVDIAQSDWLSRSAGAVYANRLDTVLGYDTTLVDPTSAIAAVYTKPAQVSFDTSVKPAGANGSQKIAVLNSDTTDSGSIRVFFNRSFGQGETIWVSYRYRAPPEMLYHPWIGDYNSGNKTSILCLWHHSNDVHEIVMNVNDQLGTVNGYHQDGNSTAIPNTAWVNGYLLYNSAIDQGTAGQLTGVDPSTGNAWSAEQIAARRYGPIYQAKSQPRFRGGYGDPICNISRQWPDEWITITYRVIVGTWGTASSRWTCWMARDSQPSVVTKLWDSQGIQLGQATDPHYKCLWLLPYVTNRSGGGRKVTGISGINGVSVLNATPGVPIGSATLEYVASTGRFRFKNSADNYGTAQAFSPTNDISIINLASSSDGVSTTTTSQVTLPVSTLTVTDASLLPTSGTVLVGVADTSNPGGSHGYGLQQVNYTGKSGNTLTGCSGGIGLHDAGVGVYCESYIQLRLDNASLLPSVGTTTATLTVADGRPDTAMWFADVIISTSAINFPGGYAPVG